MSEVVFSKDTTEYPVYHDYDGLKAIDLGIKFEELDDQIKEIEENLKDLKDRKDFLRFVKLPRAIEEEGLKNFRLASGRGVTIETQFQVSVKTEEKGEFYKWLKDSGNGSLVTETVNHNTLKSSVKGWVQDGVEFPAEKLNIFTRPAAKLLAAVKK